MQPTCPNAHLQEKATLQIVQLPHEQQSNLNLPLKICITQVCQITHRLNCTLAKCKTCQLQTYRVQKLPLETLPSTRLKMPESTTTNANMLHANLLQTCQGLRGIPAKLHPCKMQNLPTANLQSAKLILANTAKHQTKDARIHHHKCEYATCKYPQTCQWLSGIGFQMKYCQNSMLAYHWNATIPECKVVNNQLATRKIAKIHANWMKYRWQISNEETAKVATLQGWIYSINLEPICYFGQINVD